MNKTDPYQNDVSGRTVTAVLCLSLIGLLAVAAVPLVGEPTYEVARPAEASIPETRNKGAADVQLASPELPVPSVATSAMRYEEAPAKF